MSRRLLAAAGVLVLTGAAASRGPVPPATAPMAAPSLVATRSAVAVSYRAPLPEPLRVVHPFAPPADPFGPGERGVDLGAAPAELVRAAAAGRVSFAGPVAGRGVVVLVHADGISTEYEPVRPLVVVGELVAAGTPIGRVAGNHLGCPPDRCLHWGARRDGIYLDPLSLLRPLGPVRLLPWRG